MRSSTVRLVDQEGAVHELGIDEAGRWAEPDSTWERVDLGAGVAVPGLVDAHAHLTSAHAGHMDGTSDGEMPRRIAEHAEAQLTAGVLLVVDKGTHHVDSIAMTLRLAPEVRPEVQLAGRFLTTDTGYYAGYAIEVEPGELLEAIPSSVTSDASWVKLIGDWPRRGKGAVVNFDQPTIAAAVTAAHREGRRVAIHAAAPGTPGLAVRAGVDSIEHGLFLTEDDLAMLGERGGAWVPTVAAMESVVEQLGPLSSGGRLIAEGLDNVRRLLPNAKDAGVIVMAGTDLGLRHGDVVREAERWLAFGMTEADAFAAMTTSPRRYLDEPGLVLGAPADFVLVDDAAVAALATPRLVVRCGNVVADRR